MTYGSHVGAGAVVVFHGSASGLSRYAVTRLYYEGR